MSPFRAFFLHICFLTSSTVLAQDSLDISFIQHLYNLELWEEGQLEIKNSIGSKTTSEDYSLAYKWLGRFQFRAFEMEQASHSFFESYSLGKQKDAESLFYGRLSQAYGATGKWDYPVASAWNDEKEASFDEYQRQALALLQREFGLFEKLRKDSSPSFPEFATESINLTGYANDLMHFKKKSPVLAGALSAILPGAGRVYGGQPGHGIITLLQHGVFGYMSYEAYRKDGLQSPRFILVGSIFSMLYISNIYGSAVGIKVRQKEFYHAVDRQILLDMRISLRNLYRF